LLNIFSTTNCQNIYRISTDFSIKRTDENLIPELTLGRIYYDENFKKTIYKINFPKSEIWIENDSCFFITEKNNEYKKLSQFRISNYSIFSQILNNEIIDFGLQNAGYSLKKISNQDSFLISEWSPPIENKLNLDNIILTQKNKKTNSIIFYFKDKNVKQKIYFENYLQLENLKIPTKITKIFESKSGRIIEQITFKNIKLNEINNNSDYNYYCPK